MGYNTTLFILNDAMSEIDKNPAAWWKEVQRHYIPAMSSPQEFGFGNYGNGFWVVANHHASETKIIAVGANYATILGSMYVDEHHTPAGIRRILSGLRDDGR